MSSECHIGIWDFAGFNQINIVACVDIILISFLSILFSIKSLNSLLCGILVQLLVKIRQMTTFSLYSSPSYLTVSFGSMLYFVK